MAEPTSPAPRRKPYQSWRSQQSSNWRMKDETPRPEQPPRTQQRYSDQRKENGTFAANEGTPGTRLYVGNLLYSAQSSDIEQFFADNNFKVIQITMTIDAATGKNPSYCFVDLESLDEARKAMAELNGKEVLGRPLRINTGTKRSSTAGSTPRREWGSREGTPARTTLGDYKPTSDRNARPEARTNSAGQADPDRRLYVGGLPKIEGQASIDAEMRTVFEGFNIKTASKMISPHPSKASESGNHFYLFVELATSEEADRAIEALDKKEMEWGGRLRVSRARVEKRVVREPRVTLDDFSKLRIAEKENPNGAPIES